MSKKPVTKHPTDSDRVNDKEPKLNVEVVQDLDVRKEDAEAVRGGRCTVVALASQQTMTNP